MSDMVLCGQCGEQPAAMIKVGTDDGWCTSCLDSAAESVVDRDALAEALRPNWTRDETRGIVNAILASGVITDAADLRRAMAEEIAAAVKEAHASCLENVKCEHDTAYHEGIYHVERLLTARIAREAGTP